MIATMMIAQGIAHLVFVTMIIMMTVAMMIDFNEII